MKRQQVLTAALYGLVLGGVATSPALLQLATPREPRTVRATAPQAPASFADVIERVLPAVVSVAAYGSAADLTKNGGAGPQAIGSGFLVSPEGHVVTNNHVVQGASRVRVVLADKRVLDARVVGRDPPTDLALLKTAGRNLPFVSFAENRAPRVGDWVIAVRSPFGLGGNARQASSRPTIATSAPRGSRYLQIEAAEQPPEISGGAGRLNIPRVPFCPGSKPGGSFSGGIGPLP